MLKLLVIPLVLIAPAFAQTGSIAGRVTDQAGKPIKKAVVSIVASPAGIADRFYTKTDSSGDFALPGIEPGRYMITATRAGYLQATGNPVIVTSGQRTSGISLKLAAAGMISGRVVNEDGDPVLGFRVGLSRGGSGFFGGVDVRADGTFVMGSLAPGIYYVCARSFGGASSGFREASEPLPVYAATYYPSAADPTDATPLMVQPGQEIRDIEIRMRRIRVYHVSGRVVAKNGAPVANARLSPEPSGFTPSVITLSPLTAFDGTFQIQSIEPGTYTLYEVTGQGNAAEMVGHTSFTVTNADLDGIVLTAGPGIRLEKKVTVEGGSTAPDLRLDLEWKGPVPQSFNHIEPASYHLRIQNLPEGAYVSAIRLGDRAIHDHNLDLTNEDDGKRLEIVVSPSGAASISGVVAGIQGSGFFGARLLLEGPDRDRENGYADATGAFEFKNLAPGEYRIVAWDSDKASPGNFDADAHKVTLGRDEHLTINPPLSPATQ